MASPTIVDGPARPRALDRYFRITERGSTVATEVRGGVVTFFAMAYIVILNPLIIGTTMDGTGHFLGGGTEPNLAPIAAMTALVAGVLTIAMGAVANFPLAIATGLGLNAVVAFTIASIDGLSWADAMGLVVISGLVILVLVMSGFREAVFRAVPRGLKTAISVGIGLFIAFIGFVDGGFVAAGSGTPVQLGATGSLAGWPILVFVVGLVLIIVLSLRKVKGALLIGVGMATVLAVVLQLVAHVPTKTGVDGSIQDPSGWHLTAPEIPDRLVSLPDFSLFGQFSLLGAIEKVGPAVVVMLVFSILLADFFDTMGTMVAIGAEAGLLDESGKPPNTPKILIVDAIACSAGGVGSVSSNTGFIESASGVGEGARTGLASIVTGGCFLLATFLSPLVGMVPQEAAAPVLVFVGFLMMTQVTGIKWTDWEIAIPAFFTIVCMPFTYSITVGLGAGFVSYALIKIALGKAKEVHPLMWITAGLFIIYFALGPIRAALGL